MTHIFIRKTLTEPWASEEGLCARKEQTSVISITCHLLCVNSMGKFVPVKELSTLHFDFFIL